MCKQILKKVSLNNIKVKPLTKEQLIISVDRLTRFKRGKYFRVFSEILSSNLIFPKYKKYEIENMDPKELRDIAQYVINLSLENMGYVCDGEFSINKKIFEYENSIFNLDEYTKTLVDNKIDYKSFIELVNKDSVKNLRWLKALASDENIENIRYKDELCFPIKEVIIVEGATEEILLPEFAKVCGYNFDKEGVYVISAGGKNQVVKMYYNLIEYLKLPIFVLLDKDAKENLDEITPRLRKTDRIHLLECGEFEDLLPLNLVVRTIEDEFSNISIIEKDLLNSNEPRTKILEEFFRTRGMHEFKKAEFAGMVKNNIMTKNDASPEILRIVDEIKR